MKTQAMPNTTVQVGPFLALLLALTGLQMWVSPQRRDSAPQGSGAPISSRSTSLQELIAAMKAIRKQSVHLGPFSSLILQLGSSAGIVTGQRRASLPRGASLGARYVSG